LNKILKVFKQLQGRCNLKLKEGRKVVKFVKKSLNPNKIREDQNLFLVTHDFLQQLKKLKLSYFFL
jgi:hypothetical protein